jgi:FecR protein
MLKLPGENDRFASAVRNLPVVEAPESVWGSIEAALDRPPRPAPTRRSFPGFLRYAAALIVVIGAVGYWCSTRPPRPRWQVERLDGSPSVDGSHISGTGSMAVGEWLQTDAISRARIKVGDIGMVEVEPNTRLRLAAAKPDEHRLTLARGDISATVSAPPRLFFVDTSSSTAVDLGCAYTMHADDAGSGLLRVTLGWVSLEWEGRESMVPAGAQCRTRPKIGPGTPYFEDASEKLQQALASFDFAKAATLDTILAESRVRDTLTLWHLLSRVDVGERPRVFDRIAALTPIPAGVSREKALMLDPETLKLWREELAWKW